MKKLALGILAALSFSSAQADPISQIIRIETTNAGFIPSSIDVKPGTNVVLEVTRKTEETCSKEIQVPGKGVKATALPLGKTISIPLGKLEKGTIKFGCGMDRMDSGHIVIR